MDRLFEEDFFRADARYGSEVARAYREYTEKNPPMKNTTMAQRMEYMAGFCKKAKLKHPDTYLAVEQARDDEKMSHCRHYAACAIMIRGESVPVSPALRARIRERVERSS